MATVHLDEATLHEIMKFTDTKGWSCSWHWKRDHNGSLLLEGAKTMLNDLGCDDVGREITDAVARIHRRYELAAILKAKIQKAEIEEIADTHQDGCHCEVCVAAGYVIQEGGN